MAKQHCQLDDPSQYDKLIQFIREPDDVNELNEASPARNFAEWRFVGRGYAKIFTSGSRQFTAAAQTHDAIDAVIETPWTRVAASVKTGQAIKFERIGEDPVYYIVLVPIDVNEDHRKMRLVCRRATTHERQSE